MSTSKTFFMAMLTIVMAVFATSCDSGSSPKTAAEGFLKAMKEGDFEEAKKYATEESQAQLDMLKEGPNANKDKEYQIIDVVDETDTSATVTYKWDEEAEKQLKMVKVEGDWKVKFNKMDDLNLDNLFEDMEGMEDMEGEDMEEPADTTGMMPADTTKL